MLANFLNKSKPINFIVFLIFFFIAFIFTVYNAFFTDKFLIDSLLKSGAILLLFLFIFFLFNFISTKNKLTFDNSYDYFFYTILVVLILPKLIEYNVLILSVIYLVFLRKIYSLHSSKKMLAKLFDSGFWLGIFFILEPTSGLLFLLIYIAVYVHNKITIHTIFAPIIGFLTPLVVYFTYYFWYDRLEEFTSIFNFDINFDLQFYAQTKYLIILISVFVLTVFSMFFKSIKAFSVNNTFKKSWTLLIYNFIVLLFFVSFLPNKNGSEIIYIFFPIAIILANGIELIKKNVLKNMVLYLFLISVVIHFLL
ncbi:hypothetical protein BW723_06155 [Polaribacter reichenbachii]|uniref:Beta-carotene 15,15'-monooxygenase n=1 Tax=Polaribacter reichenbachii TaxID=996801 RepID=A0A1B8TYD7_9FLAO|nr:DUF6427 family protein [Polaribacter reichenbachii]APZ45902.1 hypothetical protein BW723_06155 [Polaribacter reichenbachii]AUC19764.1 hypothetical protein BTO17_14170 [Polaribacter reichenbachii]OBY64667.1 hypothetical protein LPB301_09565 [Polaribacter reichenbachii]